MRLAMEKTTVGDVCSSIESAIMELQSTLNSLSAVDSCLVISDGPFSLLPPPNCDADFIKTVSVTNGKDNLDNPDNSDNFEKVSGVTMSNLQHNLESKNSDRREDGIEDVSNQTFVRSVKRRLL